MIFDADRNLYGATAWGGAYDAGAVFKLIPNPDGSWSESVIYSFSRADGKNPHGDLIFDADGNLYGTTSQGGAYDLGTVFKLSPNPDGGWTRTKLHTFKGPDGADPHVGLTLDADGNLYGTTSEGGAYNQGTAFKLAPNPDGSWTRSRLHTFKGADGTEPYAGLILDATGNIYGTTDGGGAYNYGTVFKLSPNPDGSWARSKLHVFRGPDGKQPRFLVSDANGSLYGTTVEGGEGYGVVFKITP